MNLHDYNLELPFGLRINRDHKSILEVGPLRDFITNLIKDEHTLTRRITKDYPPADASHRLHFSIHSPVTLDLYDAQGNHTGMTPGDSNSDIQFIEEEIPNSYYLKFGEGVYAGADASQKTTLKLKGLSGGTFTLKVEETSGGVSSGFTTFLDIPITKNTIATMEISTLSDSPILILDMDGDGKNIVNLTVQNGVVVMPKPEEKPAIPATSGGAVSPWFAEQMSKKTSFFISTSSEGEMPEGQRGWKLATTSSLSATSTAITATILPSEKKMILPNKKQIPVIAAKTKKINAADTKTLSNIKKETQSAVSLFSFSKIWEKFVSMFW